MSSYSIQKALFLSGILLAVFGSLSSAVAASTNISHSYHASVPVSAGMLVSLDPARDGYVLPATTDNSKEILGVVVVAKDSLLAVDETAGTVQVATSGTVSTYVSTLAGDVATGNQIAISPIKGIGQKATAGTRVIGLAQSALKAGTAGSTQQTVTDKAGKQHTVTVGYVRLNIGVGSGSAATTAEQTGLQGLVQSLTGRSVSTMRIVLSIVVALLAFVAIMTLMYTSIYGGIVAIGRNPLAKEAVMRTVVIVLLMAVGMAFIATGTISLLLH